MHTATISTFFAQPRFKAFLIHISISLLIFATFYYFASQVWYPEFYYSANGVWMPMLTVAFVDVGLGPILTLVLYKPGKPGLKFDMTMIVLFQLSALIWGSWVLYSQRPVLAVYDGSNFYCLSPALAETAQADLSRFAPAPGTPVALAFLPQPATPQEVEQRAAESKQAPAGVPDVGAYLFGKHFTPFSATIGQQMKQSELDVAGFMEESRKLEKSLPAEMLAMRADYLARWEHFTASKRPEELNNFAYFGLVCGPEVHIVAVERDSGMIRGAMNMPTLNFRRKAHSARAQ